MPFIDLFDSSKPLIACIHLQPLPGAPLFTGTMDEVMEKALQETRIFTEFGVDGLIVENFRDVPFYPKELPSETVASMSVIAHEVKKAFSGPVGVNALRNDADAALSIAVSAGLDFIRVNIHTGAALTDQGIIEGKAYETLRKRKNLGAETLIFADVRVKHATSMASLNLEKEVLDTVERGLADALIVSGSATGESVDLEELSRVKKVCGVPVFIGSGLTTGNLSDYFLPADGFIVGSAFKKDGKAKNEVDPERVKTLLEHHKQRMNEKS